jgi:hypothetical protein
LVTNVLPNPCFPEISTLPCGFKDAAEVAILGKKVDCAHIADTNRARLVYKEGDFVGVTFLPIFSTSYIYTIEDGEFFFNDFRRGVFKQISEKEACEGIR